MNIPYTYIQQLKKLPVIGQGEGPLINDPDYQSRKNLYFGDKGAQKDLKESTNTLNAFQKLLVGIDDAYAKQALTVNNVIGVQRDYANAVVNLTKRLTFLEQRNKELNKTFGINSKQAAALGTTYDKLAVGFGVSGQATRKYAQDLNKLLPGYSKIITSNDKTKNSLFGIQNAFQQQLGLSGDLANQFILFSEGNEDVLKSQLQTAGAVEQLTGGFLSAKDLVSDISGLSSNLQLQFGRIPGSLELAVMKARTLGVSFSDIAAVGEKLLDVEGSINNELEYQLLSGKRLVDQNGKSLTQQFRVAAIQGDANAQADALTKIIETQGDTIEKNVFARKQLAQTLGMEEGQLAKIVQQRKLVSQLGAESLLGLKGADLQEGIKNFKANFEGNVEDLDQLLSTFDTRTTDEILIQTLKSIESKLLTTDTTQGGLRNVVDQTGTETGQVAGLRKLILTDLKGSITDFTTSGKSFTEEISKTIGIFATATETLKKPILKLVAVIPVLDTTVSLLDTVVSKITKTQEITALGNSGLTVDATDVKSENDSIIRVNDAVLFNPKDKINIVASTSPGALDQATADISGRGQSSGPSAQEIGAAVAQALQGVNLYVSPNELAAEMAFNSYNINA